MASIPITSRTPNSQRSRPLVDTVGKPDGEASPESRSAATAGGRWRELTERVQNSGFANSRPRDASTLLLLDRSGPEPKLLMGQRHHNLKFMPGKFVFPGGRVEPQDYLGSIGCRLAAPMTAKLLRGIAGRPHPQRGYALAHAALRETQEETGIIIGTGANVPGVANQISPDFSRFSFLARAITPPRTRRRFDTRFFVVPADQITGNTSILDGEFVAIEWFTLSDARRQDLPSITRMVLDDLDDRIRAGSLDDPEAAVPFYFMRGAYFHRKLL